MAPNDSHTTGLITADLSQFGYRELRLAAELLHAYLEQPLPEEWYEEGIQICLNTSSGYVFLSNSEYQVMMLNSEKLEMWYSCPECGAEGFHEDIVWDTLRQCCYDCTEFRHC